MKTRYCYLVYCNPKEPLVYAVYSNKKSALKYANQLIQWRFDNAKVNGFEYGYYHCVDEDVTAKESPFEKREKLIFSACLKIKDGRQIYTDDTCLVKVIRKQLQK